MPIQESYQQAILDGLLQNLFESAGNSFTLVLFYNDTELSGNGYSRKTISTLPVASAVGVNGLSTVRLVTDTLLSASGGNITWDALELRDSTGTNIVFPRFSVSGSILSGESKKVTAVFGLPDNDSLFNRVSSLESNVSEITADLADTKRIDFRDYGTPDDENYDNTPALEEALADAYALGGATIYFGEEREWWFLTALDSNNAATEHHYDNVHLLGSTPEFQAQHQEAADGGDSGSGPVDLTNTYGTRFRFNLAAGTVWWSQQRDYRFGPLRFENISWQTEERQGLFNLGTDGEAVNSAFRGLYIKNSVFSCSPFTIGSGITADWLTLEGAAGYVLPEHRVWAIELHRGYDVLISDTTFRNFSGGGIYNIHGDRSVFDNCRSFGCTLAVDVSIVGGPAHVPSVYSNCYAEGMPYFGLLVEGAMITNLRTEMGYDSGLNPNAGNYALPSTISWSITAGTDEIVLSGFETGYDATNYFFPFMYVSLTSNEDLASLPPRMFYIVEVQSDRIVFANSTAQSYVGTSLTGSGDDLYRMFDTGLILVGDRCSVSNHSIGFNNSAGCNLAFVPGNKIVEVNGNAEGIFSGEFSNPVAYNPRIIATNAGIQGVWGGIKFGSKHNAGDHPLSYFDEGHEYTANFRPPIYDETAEAQVFFPGRGVSSSDNAARNLLFHKIEDTSLGSGTYIWCYLLSDSTVGWQLRPIRKAATSARYKIRCYATTSATLNVYGGKGSANTHSLTTGWNTVTGTSHGTDAILNGSTQMQSDGISAFIQLGGNNIYVAKAIVTQ